MMDPPAGNAERGSDLILAAGGVGNETLFYEQSVILEGVVSGLTITAIVGLFRWLDRLLRRRKQIKEIRNLIQENFIRIKEAKDLPPISKDQEDYPADVERYAYFQKFRRELDVAVRFRATELSYSQVGDIHGVLRAIDTFFEEFSLETRKVVPLKMAMNFYKGLAKKKWLKLEDSPPNSV